MARIVYWIFFCFLKTKKRYKNKKYISINGHAQQLNQFHLGCSVFVLSVVAQEVSGQQHPGNGRGSALFPLVAKLASHHVNQQLQPQHAVSMAAAKAKS